MRDDPGFAAIRREARDLSLPGFDRWTAGFFRNRSRWRDATGTLRGNEDLDNLRGDPRFRKALSIARAREKAGED